MACPPSTLARNGKARSAGLTTPSRSSGCSQLSPRSSSAAASGARVGGAVAHSAASRSPRSGGGIVEGAGGGDDEEYDGGLDPGEPSAGRLASIHPHSI